MSALVLFASIAVVGGWGLAGFQVADDSAEATAHVIFEGGAPSREPVASVAHTADPVAEDDYIVGDYGDPVGDLYAREDNGGWSDSVREPEARRTGSITRGALADW